MAKNNNFTEFTPGTRVICTAYLSWGTRHLQSSLLNKFIIINDVGG